MGKNTPYWLLIESVWDQLTDFSRTEDFLEQFKGAPEVARNLFAAHWCQSEVCNGGFFQFFDNSSGILGPEAVEAFLKIGMPQAAKLIAEGVAWFGPTFLRSQKDRQNLLKAYSEQIHSEDIWNPFEQLDEPFYRYFDNENGGFVNAAQAYADSKMN